MLRHGIWKTLEVISTSRNSAFGWRTQGLQLRLAVVYLRVFSDPEHMRPRPAVAPAVGVNKPGGMVGNRQDGDVLATSLQCPY